MQHSDQILCQLLEQSEAQSVLLLGSRSASVASELGGISTVTITAESWQNVALYPSPAHPGGERAGFPLRNIVRFDLVYLTDLPAAAGSPGVSPELVQCLAQIQGYCRGELLFAFAHREGLATDNQFSALGFSRVLAGQANPPEAALYRYSLHDYKTAPDWLNSRHWANPERWNLD